MWVPPRSFVLPKKKFRATGAFSSFNGLMIRMINVFILHQIHYKKDWSEPHFPARIPFGV